MQSEQRGRRIGQSRNNICNNSAEEVVEPVGRRTHFDGSVAGVRLQVFWALNMGPDAHLHMVDFTLFTEETRRGLRIARQRK